MLTCAAQDARLSGPVAGLVFDSATQSLRLVTGMPGAALLGPAVVPDLEWGSVAPNGRVALFWRNGEGRLYSPGAENPEIPLPATVSLPVLSAWTAGSSSVVLYSAADHSAQWVRLAEQGPVPGPPISLPWSGADVTAFAADERSGSLFLAIAGRGVFRVDASGETVLLLALADASALTVDPGGNTLWVADRANASVLEIGAALSAPSIQSLGIDAERLADVSAMTVSAQQTHLYLANRSNHRLYRLDRASGVLTETAELYAPATMFHPLGRASVLLLGQRSGPDGSIFVLNDTTEPSVFFVPAMGEN